jgi:hypothetical protein
MDIVSGLLKDITGDLVKDIKKGAKDIVSDVSKNVISDIKQELITSKEETKGIGEDCKTQTDCSLTGEAGGKRTSNFFSPIGCCQGKCTFKRDDYLGIGFCPNECKSGIFERPGSCKPSMSELKFYSEHKEGIAKEREPLKEISKEKQHEKDVQKIEKILSKEDKNIKKFRKKSKRDIFSKPMKKSY